MRPARSSRRPATVLMVEDEQALRELTVRMLQRLGYKVLSAALGQRGANVPADRSQHDLSFGVGICQPQVQRSSP